MKQGERKIWVDYQKKKWAIQKQIRQESKRRRMDDNDFVVDLRRGPSRGLTGFLRKTARSMMDMPWQIVQVDTFVLDKNDLFKNFFFFRLFI